MTPQQRKILEQLRDEQPSATVARIDPRCGRKLQVVDDRVFRVEQGWVGPVQPGLRHKMEGCILNEMDPYSKCVFQFLTVSQALTLDEREESQRRGAPRPAAVPERVEGIADAGVEGLVAKEVAKAVKALETSMEDKLKAAREEGAAAERARQADKPNRRRSRRASQPKAEPPLAEPVGDESPAAAAAE